MVSFLLYIVKSTCCLVLFYLGYKVLLSRETFFRFNRFVLLAGTLVCMLLPFIEIRTLSESPLQKPLLQLEEVIREEMGVPIVRSDIFMEKSQVEVPAIHDSDFSWGILIFPFYLSGIGLGICMMLCSFASLLCLLLKGRKIRMEHYTLILISRAIPPFNWGRYVVLSERDYNENPDEILTHELVHLRQRHSLDLIYMEILVFLHWFNPAVWLLKLELQEIHEYQADCGVLKSGIDATKYQLLLVKKAVSASSYTFANSFNHSKIKKRITMMLRKQSNSWARMKLVLLVPVVTCTLLAFARPDVNRKLEQLVQSEGTTISSSGQSYTKEFFDKEIDAYMEKIGKGEVSDPERFHELRSSTHCVNFFINALGEILYLDKYAKMDEIPAKLKASLEQNFKDGKPVMIHFMVDNGTDKSITAQAFGLIGKAFSEYRISEAGKVSPGLLFYGKPKNFQNGESSEIKVKLQYNTRQDKTITIASDDSFAQIRSKIQKAGMEDLITVAIKAPGDTPMGLITDIKQSLREVYGVTLKCESRSLEY